MFEPLLTMIRRYDMLQPGDRVVCAVAILPGRVRRKAYRASRAAASSPFLPGLTSAEPTWRGMP